MAAKKTSNSDLVPITLFKDNDRYKDDVKVGLNGKLYVIERGKTVMIPKPVREILDHQAEQDRRTANMISQMESDYKSIEKAYT